tara:strand:- start:3546 stop:4136 length:591 start_codon:yes stop_codon:yes gene_type:complete
MFTGIIQDIGSISYSKNGIYEVKTNLDLSDCKEGSSISCNGVCLTANNINKNNNNYNFNVNIGEETLDRTNLRSVLKNNQKINIEKSLKIGDEIGGHFVYGHVDTVTSIINIEKLQNSWEYCFSKNFNNSNKFIVEKASISINGISLTIAKVTKDSFLISVINHTYKNTNLKYLSINDNANVEFDYLARFISNYEN